MVADISIMMSPENMQSSPIRDGPGFQMQTKDGAIIGGG